VTELPQLDGSFYYTVDYQFNPNAMEFRTGGLHDDAHLLPGLISTSGLSENSIDLCRTFRRVVFKGFVRIADWFVGPEARRMLDNGVQLVTMAVDEDSEYNLQLPNR
jgi:hypothetical protein